MTSSTKISKRKALDTAICPLCGEPNHCAMAADANTSGCWCESIIFPEELLEKIPENAVRKTCVCQKCLAEYQDSINLADS
ncbi:cysteine-rich CWC family protein [Chloroflexota bacterium]